VLYRTIEAHLPSFLAHTAGDAETPGLPAFVKREFERYLRCGILAHGFTRLRCTHCAGEHLLPFSCKRRGFCPSCGGRRMADRAAFLVDEVLPHVPVRQWVLTLPYRLRYRLAWDHALCRAVLGVYARALLAFYARVARAHGIRDGQTGTVTVIQRFGSGLQLNLHYHTLVLDGVFSEAQPGRLTFHPAPPPSDEDVAWVLAAVRTRVGRLLARRQLEPVDGSTPPDPLSETSPVLARIVSASVQSCVALGPRAGARVRRLGDEPDLGHATSRGPARPSSMASISTPMSGFPPTIGPASNSAAATSSARPSPSTTSSSAPTAASSSNSGRCGAMARRIFCSSPSSCWRSSPRSLLGPRSTCCSITGSSPRMRAGGRGS
jgi:hypothetical protein